MGDGDTVLGDAVLRALAARSAARRSIGVRTGPVTVDGSVFSVFILGVDSGGGIGGAEAVWVSDCVLTDGAWGVSEGVGVMGLSFSDFTAMLVTQGGAEAGTDTG